ncbi:MAG: hypothetical protein QOH89_1897, partial [Pseudonocardiales bacterium]|nr:hypothetical protein [Pseudonocardiales bacterium]
MRRRAVVSCALSLATLAASFAIAAPATAAPPLPPRPAAASPSRMMIVGDSITQGSTGDWTWRYRLWKHLTSRGVTVDFVGPRDDLENTMTPESGDFDQLYADPAFDRDHDAQWGRPYLEEAQVIQGKVAQYTPDYLLVLLGINDMTWFDQQPEQVEASLRSFVANARKGKQDVRIVLGKVLATKRAADDPAFAARVAGFNARLAAVAQELGTDLSPIAVADATGEFTAAGQTYDGVHPNARGELRIAASFADALGSRFGIGAAYPRPYPDVPVGPRDAPKLTLTATGDTTADLAWTQSTGASAYWVWMKDDAPNSVWGKLPIALTQAYNPWHMAELQAGRTYRFKLQAAKGDDLGATSDEQSLTISGRTPGTPTGLTATPGDGSAVLRWTAAENASGYLVQMRNVTAGETGFTELPFPVNAPEWTAGALENGATYEFRLQAVNGVLRGGTTPAVEVHPTGPTPAAPTNFAIARGDGEAELTWTDAPHATGYRVYMRNVTANEDFNGLPFPVSGGSWTAGGLVNGATYEFKLQALNGQIQGGTSGAAQVRPTGPAPAAPQGLTAVPADGEATLRWSEADHATGYYVHMRNVTAGEGTFTKLPYPVDGAEWTAGQLVNGATYEFQLEAVNGYITGGKSAVVRATATGPAPGAPPLSVRPGDRKAILTWDLPDHATSVYIYMRNRSAGENAFSRLPYPVADDQFVATGLVNGADYDFEVRAYNDLIAGGTSAARSVRPSGPPAPAPEDLTAIPGDRKVTLSWTGSSRATGYYIWMKRPGEDWNRLPWAVPDDQFVASLLLNGGGYSFKIESVDGLTPGGVSNVVSATPRGPTPQVSGLELVAGPAQATLSWSGSATATGYYVQMRDLAIVGTEGPFTELQWPVTGTSWRAQWLVPGHLYEFRLQAVSGWQRGVFSNVARVTPTWPPPP